MLYNSVKKQGARTDITCRQSDDKSKTSESIGAQYGIGSRTVERAAKAVEAIADTPLQAEVAQGTIRLNEAAKDWMDANQLGRRNLTPEQFTLLLGRRYNRAKKSQGGTGANQHSEQTGQSGQSAGTSARLASEHGVSERTVRRAGQYASAVEALEQALPGAIEPGSAPPRRAVVEAAKLVEKDPQQAARVLAG